MADPRLSPPPPLGDPSKRGILTGSQDPDGGKDYPANAVPSRDDEPIAPEDRPVTRAIMDEWTRRR